MNKGERVMADFWDLLNKLRWLNQSKMKDRLQDYKPSEVHCIDYIGGNMECNVTKLAESFRMTRGAITKITKKLIEKGLIESYQKPENKKEVYFKLTAEGRGVYEIHQELHKEFQERDRVVFEQVTDEAFDHMLQFAAQYHEHLDRELQHADAEIKSKCDKM